MQGNLHIKIVSDIGGGFCSFLKKNKLIMDSLGIPCQTNQEFQILVNDWDP